MRSCISRLLMVTTAVALMAAWSQFCTNLQYADSPDPPPRFDPVRQLSWSFAQGSLLASLVFLWLEAKRAGRWLRHPGHTILLLNAIPVPVILVVHTCRSVQIYWFGEATASWFAFAYSELIYCATYAAVAVLWLYMLRYQRDQMPILWATAFGLYSAIALTTAVGYATRAVGRYYPTHVIVYGVQFLVVAVLFFASLHDVRNRIQRDWLHWFAIGVTVVAFLSTPFIECLAYFYSRT